MGRRRRAKLNDLIFFNRQLAAMIKTKLPLPEGLAVIARQIRDRSLKRSAGEMGKDLETGLSLSEAFERQEDSFPELYTSIVKAGEESGDLPGVLSGLCEYSDAMWNLQRKIRAALYYPAAVGVFVLLFIPLLVIVVVPRFADMYAEYQSRLPVATSMLLGIRNFLVSPRGLIVLLAIPLLCLLYPVLRRTSSGRRISDRFKRVAPFFGKLTNQAELWRFCRTLASLLKAGVPLVHSLQLVGATAQNTVMKSAIVDIEQRVSQGEKLGEECRRTGVFPEDITWMIAMGEERGTLNGTLTELADFYDLEVRLTCEKIQSTVGPAMIFCLGIIVAFVLISLYMPIFKLAGAMSGI